MSKTKLAVTVFDI